MATRDLAPALALMLVACTGGDPDRSEAPAPPEPPISEPAAEPAPEAASAEQIQEAISAGVMPQVVGWDLNTLGDGTGLLYDLHGAIGPQESRWVASDAADPGVIVGQHPEPGTPLDGITDWRLDVSDGGPEIVFDELPADVAAFAIDLPGFDADEPLIKRGTDQGVVYKSDRWLFGLDCDAVNLAYRTFSDPRYDTACPGAVEVAPGG